jgi:hypothetical protein
MQAHFCLETLAVFHVERSNNLVYLLIKKREPTSVPSHFFKISVNNFLINVNFVWIFKTGLAAEHEVGSGLMV